MTEAISTASTRRRPRKLAVARLDLSAPLRFAFAILLLASLSGVALWISPEESWPIVLPAVALLSIAVLFAMMLYHRRAVLPLFELGGFYGAVVTVYGTYPLLQALVLHWNYTSRNDSRIFSTPPTPAQIGSMGWLYVLYLSAFSVGYLLVRRRQPGRLVVQPPRRGILFAILVLWVPAQLFLICLKIFVIPHSGTYLDQYLAIQNLSTVPRQIVTHGLAIGPTLTIFLLTALFVRYKQFRLWIAFILCGVVFIALRSGSGRTDLFLMLLAATLLYNQLIRRWSLPVVLAGGMAALIAFTFLGYVRSPTPGGTPVFSLQSSFRTVSEFEVIFGNAYDLRYVREAEGAFLNDSRLYWSDLAMLVPQQILPFKKTSGALWYLDTYYSYFRDLGGGMAFGAIPEALVGYGAVELALRGALLGLIFGAIHRVLSRRPSFWGLCFYAWMTVWSYECFRNSMLSLLQPLVYHFIVPCALVTLVAYLTASTGHDGSRLRAIASG